MTMDVETAVRRWLDAYNSDRPWDDEHFDYEMYEFVHDEFNRGIGLDVAMSLSRHPLSWKAKALLGAGLCEDILADAPDLLPRIVAMTNEEPRLRTIFAFAWETGRMTEDAKEFLRRMQRWAAAHDPAPERPPSGGT